MATTDVREKKSEKEIEVYPTAELINAVNRMLTEPIPVKIALISPETGDIAYIARLIDLGITRQALHSHAFYRSHLWANFIGELLIRNNLPMFCDRLMSEIKYDALVKKHNHVEMGLRQLKNDDLMFQFHVSLIFRLFNEFISQEITDEVSKVIISGAKKIKRAEEKPSITSFVNDGNNLRLIVSNHTSIRHCFENAIKTILKYYNITGKEVFITQNTFNWEIQIKDEGKCSPE